MIDNNKIFIIPAVMTDIRFSSVPRIVSGEIVLFIAYVFSCCFFKKKTKKRKKKTNKKNGKKSLPTIDHK
jgi:hypothetical protein